MAVVPGAAPRLITPVAAAVPLPAAPSAVATSAPRIMAGAAVVAAAPVPAPFSRFEDWTNRYLAASGAERTALLAEGRELAAERRAVLSQLIRTDPRAALAVAVPMVARQQLPAAIVALLEDRVSGRGDLALLATTPAPGQVAPEANYRVASIDGDQYRVHVFGRRDIPGTVTKTSMNGIALDGHFAVAESPLRVLEPGETAGNRPLDAVCDVSGATTPVGPATPLNTAVAAGGATAVEYDGTVHVLCGANHLAQAEGRLLAREESNVAGAAGSSDVENRPSLAWTHGPKKLLVIRVDFSDRPGTPTNYDGSVMTDSYVSAITEGVRTFYANSSFGQTSLTFTPAVNDDSPDVSPVLRMPNPGSYYEGSTGSERSWQLHLDARGAAQAAGIDVAGYDRVGVVFSGLNYWWAGLGEVAGRNFWINAEYDFRVVAHELGHTYGMMHANAWLVNDGNPISAAGSSSEYGDVTDIMGSGNSPFQDFSHWNKSILQWIPDSAVTSATTSGTYRVYRFDDAAANLNLPRAIKVRRNDQQDYWIGYRAGSTNPNFTNGAYVLWGYHTNQQGNLLDLTPGTANNFSDAPLAVGSTFSDPGAGVSFTTVARGGSGADQWLDLQVNTIPSIRWSQTGEYNVPEQEGQAVVRVVREGDAGAAITVNYTMADGSATSPADYTAQSGTLVWPAGDTTDKTISIPIQSDTLWEAGERFTITLASPTGATIYGSATTTVAILDAGIRDFGWMPDYTNQPVEKMLLLPDGSFIAVGRFPEVFDAHSTRYPRQGVAKFSADGRFINEYAEAGGVSGADSIVHAVVRQPDGHVVLGGSFLSMQGASRANLVRLLDDGTVDPTFTAGANGPVWSLVALPDGRLLMGGAFTSVNGVPREYVARLNADGTLDTSFVGPDFDGTGQSWVRSLAVQADGRILAGGKFTLFGNGAQRSGLCRMTAEGALDASFVVREGVHQANTPNAPGEIRAIAVQPNGAVLIGGAFGGYNGVNRGAVARLTAGGELDAGFAASVDNRCNALLALPDGRVAVGGWFFNANGTAVRNIAIFSVAGGLEANTASAGGTTGEIYDLQLAANGRLQFCGDDCTFQYTQENRPFWRLLTGIANPPGSLQFTSATAHAAEGGSVTLTVTRTGGSGGAVNVGYSTSPGTASSADFSRTTGTLSWADGDASPRSITVPLASDGAAESNETFTLGLGAPVLGGANLGAVLQATITIDDSAPPPPGNWQARDIGNVGAAGSSSESGGVVTLAGSGADIWENADSFHFRAQSLTGDGAIIARVASMGNTHPWAKVGLMFREDLTPGSREVMAYVTPGNRAGIQYRLTPGGSSVAGPDVGSTLPVWLMLARAGDTFGAYRSDDGNTWTSLGTINCDLPNNAYVGLAISSHAAGTMLTATLDHVELIGVEPPANPPAAPSHLASTSLSASTVTLTWVDNSTDETGFSIERSPGFGGSFVEVGTAAANSQAFNDAGLTANTTYSYRVRAQRGSVYSNYSDPIVLTTNNQPPSGWQGLDIGNVGPGGSQTVDGQAIAVRAGGADIWFAADGFRYVYQTLHGDGEIKARVTSITNTHPWAKAGVMFRESLAADSRNVAYLLTADNVSGLQVRTTTGGDTTLTNGPWVNAPYWVRLVRSGDLFTASTSSDGTTWTVQGTQTLAMGADIYVGVAASAHTTTQLTTAAFEYVQLTTATPPPPPPPPPPGDWTQTNLGAGSGTFATPAANSVTVNAVGTDLWGQFDDGQFVQRAWSGDGQIIVRLDSLTNIHPWTKAGLMFRENLTATSRNVFVGLTPGNGATLQVRAVSGGTTSEVQHDWLPGVPCWLALTRAGDTFTAAYSTDNVTWKPLGSTQLAMAADIYVGFGVSSHATASATAAFSNVLLRTEPPRDGWQQATWGAGSGSFTKTGGVAGSNQPLNIDVTAAGADIWGPADDGLYVYVPWVSTDGDGEISARVDSMTNTHPWAKAGLMFRSSLEAGATNVFLALTPGVGITLQVRSSSGAVTTEAQHSWLPGAPCWLRLRRSHDNTARAEFSGDGQNWTLLGITADPLPDHDGFAGLGVSSHVAGAMSVRFTSVALSPAI